MNYCIMLELEKIEEYVVHCLSVCPSVCLSVCTATYNSHCGSFCICDT